MKGLLSILTATAICLGGYFIALHINSFQYIYFASYCFGAMAVFVIHIINE